jgi:hypothetical protein
MSSSMRCCCSVRPGTKRQTPSCKQALDEEDRLIRERSAQNKNPPWVEKVLEEARAERLEITERLRQQANGEAP